MSAALLQQALVPASLPLKNERHEAFCYRYAELDNATQAYADIFGAKSGAKQSAHRLLQRPEIVARVEYIRSKFTQLVKERADQALTDRADRKAKVLRELEIIGFSDVFDYEIGDDGWIEVRGELPRHLSRAIESIQVDRKWIPQGPGRDPILEIKTKFKLWSKPTALKMLGDHERLFGEQPEAARSGDRPVQVFIIAGREVYL